MKLFIPNLLATVCMSAHPATAPGSTTCTVKSYPDFATCVSSKSATIFIKVKFAKSSKLDTDRLALMSVGGTGVTFESDASNPGILDGTSKLHWDGKGGNEWSPQAQDVLHLHNWQYIKIDITLGDTKGGHNTNGFHISGNGITIQNSWVHNQDDCLAIT
ncbi:hypothetical protein BJ741DRAFT_713508 [Chytriomyces cf. hyalinus JEL632]|nr:hypothetical protein BJ741DRAFT_713508 [Chytriomyces cf. hyalinus JEL632]